MSASDPIQSVLATGELAVESSASALPTTVETAAAEGPKIGSSLFDPLHDARHSLGEQSEVTAQLHPLNSTLQSLYTASSTAGRLSRDQYRQLIAQIRHSVSQFAATTPALKLQQQAAQAQDTNTANQLRRYISLLTETSTHTAALAHSIAPIKSAEHDVNSAAAQPPLVSAPFPPQLQVGVFRAGLVRAGSSDKPVSSWQSALEALGALCETLESTAKRLGLETFAEPSSEATEQPTNSASSSSLTHTLTLGAKILVIDIELHIVKNDASQEFRPKTKLKLSYATDSANSQQARDSNLGAVLERDVQLMADQLFGTATSSRAQQGREIVARALAVWTSNLNELLVLDDLEARASEAGGGASRPTDLFAAMQELSAAVVRIADAEASSHTSEAALLNHGHGLHKLHETRPFLQSTFARDPTSEQDYTLSIGVQAIDLPVADAPAPYAAKPSFPLSQAAADLLASSADLRSALSLGSVPSASDSKKRVPLHVVLRLSPPVVVTRPTAAKLASICNLKQITPHNSNTGALGVAPKGATWFEDVLASSWSQRPNLASDDARRPARCTFTLAQSVESVRSPESQGLVIDSLPLLSGWTSSTDATYESNMPSSGASILARLFAAIEVLRDEIKVTELMHSAIALGESKEAKEDDLSLDDILASASEETSDRIAVTLAFRTPISGALDEAQQNLSLQLAFRVLADSGATVVFDASISPSQRTAEVGWLLTAVAKSEAPGETASKDVRLDSSSSEAQSIVAKLVDLESLQDVVINLVCWAEKQLDVRLKKPAEANGESFDPLSYEQQNVHAIYETIAPHFSNTRYKPWPLIPAFLSTIPPGSLGADLGCGNGKYLPIRSTLALSRLTEQDQEVETKRDGSLLTVGVDRSSNLISLARTNFGMLDGGGDASKAETGSDERRQEVAVGDAIHSSLRTGLFDYAISIATIHHFSTWERRRASVQELIRIVAPVEHRSHLEVSGPAPTDPRLESGTGRGRFMIFVWALEQKDEGKRQFQADDPALLKSKPEIDDPNHVKSKDRLVTYSGLQTAALAAMEQETHVTDDQDVLVPWVLTEAKKKKAKAPRVGKGKKGQQPSSPTTEIEAGLSSLQVDSSAAEVTPKQAEDAARPVYNRYYHMFRAGELESLVADAAATMPSLHRRLRGSGEVEGVEVVHEAGGWERGNWWGVWRVQWAP
ncbi:hypothetical protein EX895_002568 [Sporisorium graminicola]|uniref:Mediator of RNA polymerase II transcription subunit 1 n=1 Tax=Sporisorium graminicola TaxID=280036 RepID=A0A4V6EU86_9BASI|nr:hypothetical protein EX895_002568 [Sporisorium graminicola]TKY88579.1 hypothetical protein EX895_002568 [Sporisorium graminicola]